MLDLPEKRRCRCTEHRGDEPWHGSIGGATNHRCRCPACRMAQSDRNREYKKANPEIVRANAEAYRRGNRSKVRERSRNYYRANRDKSRARYEANRGEILAYTKEYRKTHADYFAEYGRAYREANKLAISKYRKSYNDANRVARRLYDRKRYEELRKFNPGTGPSWKPWTPEEDEMVMRKDLRLVEIAARTGRSYKAVAKRRSRLRARRDGLDEQA